MALYGIVIFLGAFLLFQVQPLIARALLPWFGGSAAVWLTCLMFFQVALLLGYLYSHLAVTRVSVGGQARVHLGLLLAACFFLPILPSAAWKPEDPSAPVLRILLALAATVGLPYLALAATSPLVQAWYAQRHPGEPYRFFAVSNAGSLLGLLSYPTLAEPFLTTKQQAWLWSGGFVIFGLLLSGLALRRSGAPGKAPPAEDAALVTRTLRVFWILLPACASILLLAVTNHLTQNVAPVPFLWVLPLSLYLLSFVVTFGRHNWYHRGFVMRATAVLLAAMAYALHPDLINTPIWVIVPLYATGFFFCCWVCHGELVRMRPPASRLTSYYLMISLGGALGGAFVSLVAPVIYSGYFELHVGLGVCAALMLAVLRHDPHSGFYMARWQPAWLALVALVAGLAGGLAWTIHAHLDMASLSVRSFYGTLRVMETTLPKVVWLEGDGKHEFPQRFHARKLINGTIDHGTQFFDVERQKSATAYYVPRSGVALTIREAAHRGPVRVGVIGLGAGTMAALGVRGDVIRFYEINPLVEQVARTQFTYLKDTAAKVEVVMGDARLSLEREPPQNYDVFAVDAFSGDAIPVHLLTVEAFEQYFRHVKPGGAVVVHVSNQHLDLQPVVQKIASHLGKKAVVVESAANDPLGVFRAFWVIVSDRAQLFEDLEIKTFGRPLREKPDLRVWTDQYSNILRVLRPLDWESLLK